MSLKKLSKKQSYLVYIGIAISIILILSVAVYSLSGYESNKKMLTASSLYQKFLIIDQNPNTTKAKKQEKLEEIIQKYPNTIFGIFSSWKLADTYITKTKLNTTSFNINIRNYPKAAQVLQQSVNANPKDSLTKVTKTRLARLYIASKEPNNAIKTIKSIKNYKKNSYPLVILGQAYYEKGNKKEAVKIWKAANKANTNSSQLTNITTQLINNS